MGLHPLDVRVLIDVLQRLVEQGATVIVIEHDLDLTAWPVRRPRLVNSALSNTGMRC